MSVNRVEVDSDEDDNEQGDTNNQTQAGSESPEDSGGSEETSTESGADEKTTESAEVVETKRRKSMFPNYLLSFSPVLYCHEDKHNACLKLKSAKSFIRICRHFENRAKFALKS